MARIATPPPPLRVALEDDDGNQRLRTQLYLWSLTVITVAITAWLITLGPVPGIIAVVTAKHVLVAFLVMGLRVNASHNAEA
jgi:hypothetical protein